MHGTLANNLQILQLVSGGLIRIEPFKAELLKAAHYPLTVYAIFVPETRTNWVQAHCFDTDGPEYELKPNAYVIVEVRETIVVQPGIVGKFIPSSNLVDQCIGLTAGRVEHPFGQQRETLRFGMKNLSSMSIPFSKHDYIAYVEFYDMRGLDVKPIALTPRDEDIYERRRVDEERFKRASDDGPYYTTDDQ